MCRNGTRTVYIFTVLLGVERYHLLSFRNQINESQTTTFPFNIFLCFGFVTKKLTFFSYSTWEIHLVFSKLCFPKLKRLERMQESFNRFCGTCWGKVSLFTWQMKAGNQTLVNNSTRYHYNKIMIPKIRGDLWDIMTWIPND